MTTNVATHWRPDWRFAVNAAIVIALYGAIAFFPLSSSRKATLIIAALMLLTLNWQRRPSVARTAFFSAIVLVTKLVLVSQNEIISTHNDAWAYLSVGGSDAPWAALGPSPGYPIWLWIGMHAGVPQRIAIELLFFAGTAVFAAGIGRAVAGTLGYCMVLAAAIFSPATYFWFDKALSDAMYAAMTLVAVGIMTWMLGARTAVRDYRSWIALGCVFGVLQITRKESVLVLFVLFVFFLTLVVRDRQRADVPRRQVLIAAALPVAVIVGLMMAVVSTTRLIHEETDGVWATSIAELPSHEGMLARLSSIETAEAPMRFIPISHEALLLAYRSSESLAPFRAVLEKPDNPYMLESERSLGRKGEIGAGWIWHIFNAAAPELGIREAAELDRTYRRINSELDAGFANGTLRERFVIHPLLGATPSVWLSALPASLASVLRAARTPYRLATDAFFASDLFDRVCLRREALLASRLGELRGWAYTASGKVVAVHVVAIDDEGHVPESIGSLKMPRPDLRAAMEKEGQSIPLDSGFKALVQRSRSPRLEFSVSGTIVSSAVPLTANKVETITLGNQDRVIYAIDALPTEVASVVSGWRLETMDAALDSYATPAWWSLLPILFLAAVASLILRARRGDQRASIALLVLLLPAALIVGRLMLYALVDAAAWIAEPRYLQLAGIMMSSLGVASFAALCFFGERPGAKVPRPVQ